MTVDSKGKWREFALIIAVGIPFLFLGLGSIELLDRDEGMYGSISREIAEGGDWITPHFNGIRYLEKPPLYFWLTATTINLFGPSEWTVRLWSALPAFGAAVLTWRIGALLYGGHAGLLSAIVLMTNVGLFRYARVAATDCLLVFSLTLAVYGFVKATLSHWSTVNGQQLIVNRQTSNEASGGPIDELRLTIDRAAGPALFWLGMAIGVLSKGLIGVVLPVMIIALWAIVNRLGSWEARMPVSSETSSPSSLLTFKPLYSPLGWLLFLGLTGPWHLLAAWVNPGFFDFYVVDNQLLRFLSTRTYIEDDVPIGTIAFLGLMLIWFFPWSLSLPGALRDGFRDTRSGSTPEEKLRLLVGLWALVVLGFFSFSGSKLEHYMLPALPPLSLMVGALWSEAFASSTVNSYSSTVNGQVRGLKWPLAVSTLGCAIVGAGLLVFADRLSADAFLAGLAELNVYYRIVKEQGAPFPFASMDPFVRLAQEWGALLLIGVPLAFLLLTWRGPLSGFVGMTGVAGVAALLVLRLLFIVEPLHSAKSIALALNGVAHAGEPIVHNGSLEYSGSLPFYTGRQIHVLNGRRGDLEFGSRYPEGQGLFLDDRALARMWSGSQRVYLVTRDSVQENALAGLSGQTVFHLGRYGSRELYSNKSTASDN